jgi:hypothetical protein
MGVDRITGGENDRGAIGAGPGENDRGAIGAGENDRGIIGGGEYEGGAIGAGPGENDGDGEYGPGPSEKVRGGPGM